MEPPAGGNPLFLNLSYCDDPELAAKLNAMSPGNADQFRSRASQFKGFKKSRTDSGDNLVDRLNSFDFKSAIKEKYGEVNQTNSESNKPPEVDLKNVNVFNMPPSMQIPDSDEEELDDIYHSFDTPSNYKFQKASDFLKNKPITIISRKEWGAVPPQRDPTSLKHPIKNIVITYKTETSVCFTREECMQRMRELQKYHMEQESLSDIPFNFMVGHDGTIYEGRGWHAEPSHSLQSYPELQGNRLDIGYFGDYRRVIYPAATNSAIFNLVHQGAEKGWVHFYCDFMDYREGHPAD